MSGARRALGPIVVAGVIGMYGLWALGHLGGTYWDSDEGINLMKARMMQDGFTLYRDIWADQPPGLTVLLAWVFAAFGATVVAARTLVVAFALLGLAAMAWVAREAGGTWLAAAATAAFAILAPNFFWASRAVMIGLPALALSTLAIAAVLAFARSGLRRWLVLSGLALGASLSIKLIGVYLLVPFGLAIVLRRAGARVPAPGAPGSRGGALASAARGAAGDGALFAVAATAPLLVAVAPFDAGLVFDQVVGTVAAARGVYGLDTAWNAEKLAFWLSGDQRALAAMAAFGVAVLVARRSVAGAVVLAWTATTVAALLTQAPLWPKHHFLALLVAMAPLAGIAVDELATRLARRRWATIGDRAWLVGGAVAILIACTGTPAAARALSARSAAAPYKENGELPDNDAYARQGEATALVRAWTEPDDFIVTDYHMIAFQSGRRLPPELCVISGKRLAVAALGTDDLIAIMERYRPAAVLFWSGDRLQRVPGYRDWVERHYRPAATVLDDYELFVLPDRGRDDSL